LDRNQHEQKVLLDTAAKKEEIKNENLFYVIMQKEVITHYLFKQFPII
jgi:hypothetical protein